MAEDRIDREVAATLPIAAPAPRELERCLASLQTLRPEALRQALRAGGPHMGVIYRWIGEIQIRLVERARRLDVEQSSPGDRQMATDSAVLAGDLAKMRVDRRQKMTVDELNADISANPLSLCPKDF